MNFFKKTAIIAADVLVSARRAAAKVMPAAFSNFPTSQIESVSALRDFSRQIKGFDYPKNLDIELKMPIRISGEPIHENFLKHKIFKKKLFVLSAKNARAVFNEPFIIDESNSYLSEFTPYIGRYRKNSSLFFRARMPEQKTTDEKVLVMFSNNNYFHWMSEVVPRYFMAKKLGIKFDKVLTGMEKDFQKETVQILGISGKQIIPANEQLNLRAKELVIPSLPCSSGQMNRFVCDALRETFLKKSQSKSKKKKENPSEKIYITRGNASNGRMVVNDDEVKAFLKENGFCAVSFDGLSITEQAKITNSARAIISYHGGALTNLVFAKKGTKVVELFHPDYINVCYWFASNVIGLKYYYDTALPVGPEGNYNVKIPIAQLEEIIKKINE